VAAQVGQEASLSLDTWGRLCAAFNGRERVDADVTYGPREAVVPVSHPRPMRLAS
jgi:hypothetical protein